MFTLYYESKNWSMKFRSNWWHLANYKAVDGENADGNRIPTIDNRDTYFCTSSAIIESQCFYNFYWTIQPHPWSIRSDQRLLCNSDGLFGGIGSLFSNSNRRVHISRLNSRGIFSDGNLALGGRPQLVSGQFESEGENADKDCSNGGNRVPIFVNQVAGTLDASSGQISEREKEFWRVFFCLLGIGVILTGYAILKR